MPFYLSFFFNDTTTTEIYTLSLHDALPISQADDLVDRVREAFRRLIRQAVYQIHIDAFEAQPARDRKSTRLNSSHVEISYAVFCLKKKTLRLFGNIYVSEFIFLLIVLLAFY